MDTTALDTQWNQQMFIPVLKQEIENYIDEEYTPSSVCMHPSEPVPLSQHVNYYDGMIQVSEQVKVEFPGDEYPQAYCSMNSKIVSENNKLVNVMDKVKVKNEQEDVSFYIKQEKEYNVKEATTKLERLDEKEMLDNAREDSSIHYDVLVNPPREPQYDLSGKIIKNSCNEEQLREIKKPKNNAQKCKEYRERQKIKKEIEVRKKNAQRCKEYRERLKSISNAPIKSSAEYKREYRRRMKLKKQCIILNALLARDHSDNSNIIKDSNEQVRIKTNSPEDYGMKEL